MPVKGAKLCGARCRTKNGAPCTQTAMRETGRCKMHGGYSYLNRTHGRRSLKAQAERKHDRNFLKELKQLSADIE